MSTRADIMQGTLDLMVLRTLETLGPLHGWGIAQRLEQVSEDALRVNQGTLYPALLRLEQRGWIRRSGAPPRTTAAPASTASPPADAGSSAPSGQQWRLVSGIINACSRRRSDDAAAAGLAFADSPVRSCIGRRSDAARRGARVPSRDADAERDASAAARRGGPAGGLRCGWAASIPQEAYRDQRGLPWLDTLLQDVRYAGARMRRDTGFAGGGARDARLGIGATTTIFSLVRGVLLDPLPYPRTGTPGARVRVNARHADVPGGAVLAGRATGTRTARCGASPASRARTCSSPSTAGRSGCAACRSRATTSTCSACARPSDGRSRGRRSARTPPSRSSATPSGGRGSAPIARLSAALSA